VPAADEGFSPAINSDFRRLRETVDAFRHREDQPFLPSELGQQIEQLANCRDQLSLELCRLAAVFSKSREWERQGANCDSEWLRFHCHLTVSDAARHMTVAEHLDEMSEAAAEIEKGTIGFGHMVAIAYNAQWGAKTKGAMPFDERPLVERAKQESVSRFQHTCEAMRHMQNPEQAVKDEATAVEMRELRFSEPRDGMVRISGELDSTGAAAVKTAIKSLSARTGKDDHRRSARRDADALIEMATMLMNTGTLPTTGGQRPHLTVTCTLETLMGLKGAPSAELEYGQPISGATVVRLACDSEITKILLDDRLVPVSVGHTRRTLTRKERRALDARDGGCRYPGCHQPASRCEAHHVVFFCRGGKTKLRNMILLCPAHHWRVHEGGWNLCLTAAGEVVVTPPQSGWMARAGPAFAA
jgi:hypothetical protein